MFNVEHYIRSASKFSKDLNNPPNNILSKIHAYRSRLSSLINIW